MVLSKPDILRYIERGDLRFEPEIETDQIDQVSIDLRLDRIFTVFQKPAHVSAIHIDPSIFESAELWKEHEQDTFRLEPNGFVLAQTLECVFVPNDLVGFVEGRSTWARLGVTIHITAPKIDPGFNGPITLEMTNFSSVAVDLRAVIDQPAQLILMRLTEPLEEEDLYGRGEGDIFQNQSTPTPRTK